MGFWQTFMGTKTYCVVCGAPIREVNARLEAGPYCSEACVRTIERLSSPPRSNPQPAAAVGSEPPTRRDRG
ncbi:MAG: hypothetical protein HY898_36100 [Deltaproteobacteria bacterium]|nr:hypothetical protein [Deltaproteobacteria bacterium]